MAYHCFLFWRLLSACIMKKLVVNITKLNPKHQYLIKRKKISNISINLFILLRLGFTKILWHFINSLLPYFFHCITPFSSWHYATFVQNWWYSYLLTWNMSDIVYKLFLTVTFCKISAKKHIKYENHYVFWSCHVLSLIPISEYKFNKVGAKFPPIQSCDSKTTKSFWSSFSVWPIGFHIPIHCVKRTRKRVFPNPYFPV